MGNTSTQQVFQGQIEEAKKKRQDLLSNLDEVQKLSFEEDRLNDGQLMDTIRHQILISGQTQESDER